MLFLLIKIAVITGVFSGGFLSSFFALGHLAQRFLLPKAELSVALQTLLRLLLGVLLAAMLYSCCTLLSFFGLTLQLVLAVAIVAAIFFARQVLWQACCDSEVRFAFFSQYCFSVVVIFTAAIASAGSYITPAALMQFTGLPIDLLIPYNGARFFLEAIPFAAHDVVPTWSVADRGPLSALLIAFYFSLFGVSELGAWLVPDPKSYSVAYLILVFLNTLAIPVLYLVLSSFSRRTAVLALLLLLSSYFFFVNILFPWPKFLAAAFFLFAVFLRTQNIRFLSGILLGASFLAHDSLVFAIVVFLVFDFCKDLRVRGFSFRGLSEQLRTMLPIIAAFLLVYLPWIVAKEIAAPTAGSRLLYFQILCDKNDNATAQPFVEALLAYLSNTPISEIIGVRIGNLLYPFDIFHPSQQIQQYWTTPIKLVRSISQLSFYQYIFAAGLPTFVAACVSLRRWRQIGNPTACFTSNFFLVSIAAVIPAALAFGCPLSTTAHVWAYPAILAAVASAATVASRTYIAALLVIPLALLNNGLFLHSELYRKRLVPLVGMDAITVQVVILSLSLLLLCTKYAQTLKEKND